MIKTILLIFAGGGLGSVLRYGFGLWLNQGFPYGTLFVNMTGSFLIGIFLGLAEKQLLSHSQQLLFAIGFCGGFTTFSTFSAESLKMLHQTDYINFSLYVFGSLTIGIIMVFLGFIFTKVF